MITPHLSVPTYVTWRAAYVPQTEKSLFLGKILALQAKTQIKPGKLLIIGLDFKITFMLLEVGHR